MAMEFPVHIVIIERMRHRAIDEGRVMEARSLLAGDEGTWTFGFTAKFFQQNTNERLAAPSY
jgi:hypothetical protein